MKNFLEFFEKKSQFYFNLYNPMFCGNILRTSITRFNEITNRNMPFSLIFFVLPLILDKELRTSINPHKNLHAWVLENPHIITGLDKSITELIDLTKISLIFLLQSKLIGFDNNGCLQILEPKKSDRLSKKEEPVSEYYRKARTIGTWFAELDDEATIFSFFGVKP